MILAVIHMKVKPRKRKELSQAITSLLSFVRSEKGCVLCDFFHGVEDENIFCLLQEWETRKHFETYSESEYFKVLRGAMHLLDEPWEIILYQRSQPAGKLQGNGLDNTTGKLRI